MKTIADYGTLLFPIEGGIMLMAGVKNTEKRDDLVYDVGLHKGEDTDFYLKKGFSVVAFEADPTLAAYCRDKFSNEIRNGKLTIVEGAIVELAPGMPKNGTVKFYKNKDVSVWGTVATDWAQRNELLGTSNEIIESPIVDFVECLEKYGIPHHLKIDIEGMDMVCLRALVNFANKPDFVSIESEKVSFGKLVEDLNVLIQLGYTNFKAVQQCGISDQKEPNPSREGAYVGYKFQEGSSGLFGRDLPNDWKNYKALLDQYNDIFFQYRIFGDYGMKKYFLGKMLIKVLSKILHKPIPGWYDTHAMHSSVSK